MRKMVKPPALPDEPREATDAEKWRGDHLRLMMPHPARNLGPHLKPPSDGEIVTSHHRGAKKPK